MKNQNNGTKETSAQPMPEALALATLAAQPRFSSLPERRAITAALALWREAGAALERERKQLAAYEREYVQPFVNLRQPKKYPASFADFLRLVVPGKDEAERVARFREFLRKQFSSQEASQLLADFRATSFNEAKWQTLAIQFRKYWAEHKSQVKSAAGKKGAAARARV